MKKECLKNSFDKISEKLDLKYFTKRRRMDVEKEFTESLRKLNGLIIDLHNVIKNIDENNDYNKFLADIKFVCQESERVQKKSLDIALKKLSESNGFLKELIKTEQEIRDKIDGNK